MINKGEIDIVMYDCSKEFIKFYQNHVVLPAEQQNHLRKKRKLNINRLKKGLEEYNEERGTNLKIADFPIRGNNPFLFCGIAKPNCICWYIFSYNTTRAN